MVLEDPKKSIAKMYQKHEIVRILLKFLNI